MRFNMTDRPTDHINSVLDALLISKEILHQKFQMPIFDSSQEIQVSLTKFLTDRRTDRGKGRKFVYMGHFPHIYRILECTSAITIFKANTECKLYIKSNSPYLDMAYDRYRVIFSSPSVCMYVCLSVRFRGKRDFLGP